MSEINWDTQHGRAFLDLALCRAGSAGPGDVLVIRYGGCADRVDALKFMVWWEKKKIWCTSCEIPYLDWDAFREHARTHPTAAVEYVISRGRP